MSNLLLVGCGKMGSAMLFGWLKIKPDAAGIITIVEPGELAIDVPNVNVVADASELPDDYKPDVVVFAVKPQVMDETVPDYARFQRPEMVFLSIAAGKATAWFENLLGADAAIVRAMPNMPAAVGRGISTCFANAAVKHQKLEVCLDLLLAVGEVAVVDDEALMDAATAVSGSGPAYVFLLAECLARAGIEAGLPEDLALALAKSTISGSGELLKIADETPETLRQNVTSPGGTTAAALDVLTAPDGLQQLLTRAVAAAADRSRQLAD